MAKSKIDKAQPAKSERAEVRNLDSSIRKKILKLTRYYKECVQIESLSDICFWNSAENEDFIQCKADLEWLSSGKETFELKSEDGFDISRFGRRIRWIRRPTSYYYSYPIFIQRYKRRDTGEESTFIKPLLIFPIEVERNSGGIQIKRLGDFRPQVNAGVLSMRSIVARPEQKRVFIQRILEKWNEDSKYEDNIRQVISDLREEFGLDNFIDEDLDKLASKTIELDEAITGFYASGLIFVTQGSKYTFGLEEELETIEQLVASSSPLSSPVLEDIIERKKKINEILDDEDQEKLVEITPLNDEQRQAIKSCFKNTLSVITGPPGTGKSQVVINIVANAVARGESILFGSKNHQAVDVVLQRMYEIQKHPMILKFGQNAKESMFAERMLSSVDRAISRDKESLTTMKQSHLSELEKIYAEEKQVWKKINDCYKIRNNINQVDALIESIENRLPQKLQDLAKENAKRDLTKLDIRKLKKIIQEESSGKRGFLSSLLSLFGFKANKRISKLIIDLLGNSKFSEDMKSYFLDKINNKDNLLETANQFCDIVAIMELYSKCLSLFNNEDATIQKVLECENKLIKLQSSKCSISPDYIDIIMEERLRNLGSDVRSDIADYNATIKRIEEDRIGGDLVEKLRKQKKALFSSVVKAFPAIAVTNLSVRHVLPLEPGIIDLVVIDEASQCDIASALPMLIRAKRAVIIGDEKQLIHVSNISKIDDQQIQTKHGLEGASEQRFLYSSQSLFDLCKTTVGTSGFYTILKDHYRSRAEIINFSNKFFYSDQLKVWTDYRQLKETGTVEGIHWHNVKGKVIRPSSGSAFNLEEAEKVLEVLENLIPYALEKTATIGIVTPFREQENKIRSLIVQRIPADIMEQIDLKIDTAHGYQGDERDIIIFSTVVASGVADTTKRFLVNTQNLFNVAITRPRSELHIVGDRAACARCGIEYLERFVQYVGKTDRINIYERGRYKELFDSKWEELFYNKLKSRGINTTPQLAIHQYKLDLAIESHNPPIDIEIDGEWFHRDITGERCVSDIKRDIRLSMLGWIVKRFWVYELKYDLERCLKEVEAIVHSGQD